MFDFNFYFYLLELCCYHHIWSSSSAPPCCLCGPTQPLASKWSPPPSTLIRSSSITLQITWSTTSAPSCGFCGPTQPAAEDQEVAAGEEKEQEPDQGRSSRESLNHQAVADKITSIFLCSKWMWRTESREEMEDKVSIQLVASFKFNKWVLPSSHFPQLRCDQTTGKERERARVQPCGRKRDAAKERICNAGWLSFREIALNTNCGICICF